MVDGRSAGADRRWDHRPLPCPARNESTAVRINFGTGSAPMGETVSALRRHPDRGQLSPGRPPLPGPLPAGERESCRADPCSPSPLPLAGGAGGGSCYGCSRPGPRLKAGHDGGESGRQPDDGGRSGLPTRQPFFAIPYRRTRRRNGSIQNTDPIYFSGIRLPGALIPLAPHLSGWPRSYWRG